MGDGHRITVSTRKLAKHLGITPQRVNQLSTEGHLHKLRRDKFNLDDTCIRFRKYKQDTWEAEQARAANVQDYWTTKAKREMVLIERDTDRLRVSRGELIPRTEILPAIERIIGTFKDNTLGRGRKVSAQCVGKLQAQIAEIIEDADRANLAQLNQAFTRMVGGPAQLAAPRGTHRERPKRRKPRMLRCRVGTKKKSTKKRTPPVV